jgi:hypothetical protein
MERILNFIRSYKYLMKNNKEIDLLPDQPLGEKLIKKGFWLYLFSFLIAPAGYVIKVIISNSVSVADV